MDTSEKMDRMKLVHTIVGISIMFLFKFLPPFLEMTDIGMEILGIFLGTLYLWTTSDPIWSSLLSVLMVGFSSYASMGQVAADYFGDQTVFQLLFTMLFSAGLLYYGITKYMVRWCLSMKLVNGKPWAITFLLMLSSLLISVFAGPFVAIFLFFPIMMDVYQIVGFTKEDVYVKITLVQVVLLALIGSAITPYRGSTLSTINFYGNMLVDGDGQVIVEHGEYFLYTFMIGIAALGAITLVSMFIIRPNVKPLKELTLEQLHKKELPPMSKQQKIFFAFFAFFVFWMLVPSFFPGIPFMVYLKNNATAASCAVTVILCIIHVDGKPVFDFQKIMAEKFSWATYLLSASALFFGGVLTADEIGLKQSLSVLLNPVFEGISLAGFVVLLILILAVLTNIGNNIVMGMLLIPIVYTYAMSTGISALPLIIILTFTANSVAALTPAASPYAAILFGQKDWLKPKDIYKYSSIFVATLILVIIVFGVPLTTMMA